MRTIAALMVVLAFGASMVACSSDNSGSSSTNTPAATSASTTPAATTASGPIPTVQGAPTVTASGLTIIEVTVGDGTEAKAGDPVTLNYTGYLADGTVFDASSRHGGPAKFSLASGQRNSLIPGGQEGVTGMKIGGTRRLIIPPDLAYGSKGSGSLIPPNATITFDFELVSIP